MRFVAGLVSYCVSVCVWADGHLGADTSEQMLKAIKEKLVAEAQTAETQVTNTAWLDSDGRLHESTMIRSDVRVKGVQVHRYLVKYAGLMWRLPWTRNQVHCPSVSLLMITCPHSESASRHEDWAV